jgi:hypothetical protein
MVVISDASTHYYPVTHGYKFMIPEVPNLSKRRPAERGLMKNGEFLNLVFRNHRRHDGADGAVLFDWDR